MSTRGFGSVHRLPSGSYRAVIYIAGVKDQKAYPTLQAAKRWLAIKRLEKVEVEASGRRFAPSGEPVTYDALAEELREQWIAGLPRVHTPRTLESYRGELVAVMAYWTGKDARRTTQTDVDRYIAFRRRAEDSTSRIRHLCDRLSQLHQLAVRRGALREVPCVVQRPAMVRHSEPEVLDADQVGKLVAAARHVPDPRCLAVILLALHAGIRRSDIARLRGEDILGESIRLTVRGAADSTKGGRVHEVPILSDELARALRKLSPQRGKPLLGDAITPFRVASIASLAWSTALGGRARLHALRHACGTAIAAAAGTAQAQAVLGHRSVATTQRYVHVRAVDVSPSVRQAIRRLTDVPRGTSSRKRESAKSL